jgi:hypothetical protein
MTRSRRNSGTLGSITTSIQKSVTDSTRLLIDTIRGWAAADEADKREDAIISALERRNSPLVSIATSLKPAFRKWLFASSLDRVHGRLSITPTTKLVKQLSFLATRPDSTSIGVWDLGAGIREDLAIVLDRLNSVQDQFVFVDVIAPVPTGLITQPDYLAEVYHEQTGKDPRDAKEEFLPNILAEHFLTLASETRKELGVDRLVGVAPVGVGDTDQAGFEWNNMTASQNECFLVSTLYAGQMAQIADRPVVVAVAWLMIGQLLVDINERLEYHADRDCLFDENELDFDSLPRAIGKSTIEPEDLRLMEPQYRDASLAMVDALRKIQLDH